MINKLFVAGISYATTNAQLEEHFAKIGRVLSATIIADRDTGQSKGFGFVEMESAELAKKAISELNGTTFDGRTLVVKEALPKVDNSNGRSPRNYRNSY